MAEGDIDITANAPDFSTDAHRVLREAMKASLPDASEAAIIASLKAVWVAQEKEKMETRARQRRAEEVAAAERARARKEEEERLLEVERKEREQARKEEEKKNKLKYVPVATGVAIPDDIQLDFPPAVLRRMRDHPSKIVPYWHFTDEGMRAGARDLTLADDGVLKAKGNEVDGFTFLVGESGGGKGLVAKKKDDELTFDEWTVATQRFVLAMRQVGWQEDRVLMFARHFVAIQTHPWRVEVDAYGDKKHALLIYAARQRVIWHMRLEQGISPIEDISEWNKEALQRAKEEAYDRRRNRVDAAVDVRVSQLVGSS
ncbi:hypothetical protein DFP72DRAFT_1074352 [Ephemerocybe angulata]|uniref:Uncharacterized protein n=1 Tax=Ephemerocybe angulata TaxID=980116 RepID=A0A8H6HM43_9AGAR|nr:hypothetical protein DFP72DRAFT_1074352 [Tulosesus angulatus]